MYAHSSNPLIMTQVIKEANRVLKLDIIDQNQPVRAVLSSVSSPNSCK